MQVLEDLGEVINLFKDMEDSVKAQYRNKKLIVKNSMYKKRKLVYTIIKEEFEQKNYFLSDCQINKLVVYFLCICEEHNNEKNSKDLYR